MRIPIHYIPYRGNADRKGLSETKIKQRLEREGWTVWRSAAIDAHKNPEAWPNVAAKYALLEKLLPRDKHEFIRYLNAVHHGLPDYLCHRRGEWKFVECKLGHEQLLESQRKCIPRLLKQGYEVEVRTLADPCTKRRRGYLSLDTNKKIIREKQLRLKLRWPRT